MSVLVMTGIYLASYPEMVVDLRSGYDVNRERDTFRIVSSLTKTAIISFFILAVGQLTFVVNILVGLYTWFKKKELTAWPTLLEGKTKQRDTKRTSHLSGLADIRDVMHGV